MTVEDLSSNSYTSMGRISFLEESNDDIFKIEECWFYLGSNRRKCERDFERVVRPIHPETRTKKKNAFCRYLIDGKKIKFFFSGWRTSMTLKVWWIWANICGIWSMERNFRWSFLPSSSLITNKRISGRRFLAKRISSREFGWVSQTSTRKHAI